MEKAAGGQDMLSPYQAMGNNPVSSMDPGGSAYYSMENYVDNRGNRFYLSPGTIASLGLPWTGDPTGFTPPPSWDYGAFFEASCNAAMMNFAKQEFENYLKRIQGDRQDENKIAQKYGLNTVTLMLNLTVPLDNKWYYHDPDDKGNGGSPKPAGTMTLSQANEWAHNGNGEGVYIDFTKIILPKSVTVERFNESKLTIQGSKAIYVRFDGADFVNPNQALVYGTIRLVLIDKNTVWAIPDEYNFEPHNTPGSFWRNMGTIMGGLFSELQFGVNGQPFKEFPIYFMGTQNIPDK